MGDMETDVVTLGALFGRYKGWRNSVETPAEPAAAPAEGEGEAEPAAEVADPQGALIVQFEATAKEDLRIGFAPAHHVKPQWRYELALGFSGNTEVTVRKYVAGAAKELELTNVFAGRTLSGEKFLPYWVVVQQGVLTAGIGQQVGVDPLVRCADPKDPIGVHQVALTTWNQPATVRNLKLEFVTETLPVEQWTPRVIVRGDPYGDEDLLTAEQRALYERECELIQRRIERFGGEFVAPDLKKFLDPKVIRRLQRTGATERGFTTGFDLASDSETAKREARMKRFDMPQFGVQFSTESARALVEGVTQEEWAAREAERQKLRERAIKFGLDPDANPKLSAAGGMNLKPATRKVREERCDVKTDTMVEFRDDAIHVYSLDDRFQQVRTNDVMEYFAGYGPWYVEWINDSSCTVVFEDAGTAGRALIALGEEVPPQVIKARKPRNNEGETANATDAAPAETAAEPSANTDMDVDMDDDLDPSAPTEASTTAPAATSEPTETPDESFNRSQWRYGKEVGSATQPASKKWRLLLRRATSDDFPPEKNKKYHERRSHPQQRGRGHRDSNSQQSRQRQNSSRSHPYARGGGGGGRSRGGDDSDDQPRGERRGRGRRGGGGGGGASSNTSDGLGLLGDFQMPSRGSGRKVTEVASSSMDD